MRFFGSRVANENLAIGIKLNEEGKIDIECKWPNPQTKEEAFKLANEYALMILGAFKKEVMPYIMTTIASHGVKTNTEKFSSMILICLNTALNPDGNEEDKNAPVIPPEKAFHIRSSE